MEYLATLAALWFIGNIITGINPRWLRTAITERDARLARKG